MEVRYLLTSNKQSFKKETESKDKRKMRTSKANSFSDADHSSGDPQASSSAVFSRGQKVLSFHGPRLYPAKIQKTEMRKNQMKYLVHYLGWNKNWDEWVSPGRLMKYNEDNIVKQRTLEWKPRSGRNLKSGILIETKPKSLPVAKGKKRKANSLKEKDSVATERLLKIQIPMILKKQLVVDRDFITKQDKLVELPRHPSVDDILEKYLRHRSKRGVMIVDSTQEILNGLRCYFDKALPVFLLYKKERSQYREVVSDNDSPSRIYGAEHLLRLFVKLPELLVYAKIEDEALTGLQQNVLNFLKFLEKNRDTFFNCSAYIGPKDSAGCSKRIDN